MPNCLFIHFDFRITEANISSVTGPGFHVESWNPKKGRWTEVRTVTSSPKTSCHWCHHYCHDMSALLSSLTRSPSSLQFTANPVNCWQHCHDKRKTLSPSLYPSHFAEFIRLYYYQCTCPIGFSDHMYCSNSLPVLLNHP